MTREKLIDPASPAASQEDGPRDADHQPAPAKDPNTTVVTLDYPIKRGEREITEITIRKPTVGTLRGTKLTDLMQIDTDAVITLLPRICELTEVEIRRMDSSDFAQLGKEAAGFLLTKSQREEL